MLLQCCCPPLPSCRHFFCHVATRACFQSFLVPCVLQEKGKRQLTGEEVVAREEQNRLEKERLLEEDCQEARCAGDAALAWQWQHQAVSGWTLLSSPVERQHSGAVEEAA